MFSDFLKRPWPSRIYRGAIWSGILASTTTLGAYWGYGGAWRNGLWHDKNLPVSAPAEATQREAPERLAELKHNFVPVIITYWGRDNGGLKSTEKVELDPEEINFAKEKLKNFEVVCDHRDNNGFYGCSLKDKNTGKVYVCFAGANFDSWGEFLKDFDDIFLSTTGAPTSQLGSTKALISKTRQITGEKDVTLIGHSLGGYCALYLIGSGYVKGPAYTFDAPGVTANMISSCASMGGLTEDRVAANFREGVTGLSVLPNTYSTLGTPAGNTYVYSNKPSWILEGHDIPEFLAQFEKSGVQPKAWKCQSQNPWPLGITSLLVVTLAVCGTLEWKARKGAKSSCAERS